MKVFTITRKDRENNLTLHHTCLQRESSYRFRYVVYYKEHILTSGSGSSNASDCPTEKDYSQTLKESVELIKINFGDL